jgi:hypothetical protein
MDDLVIRIPPPTVAQGATVPGEAVGSAFLRSWGEVSQTPSDVAVIMPSIWRSSLEQALRSVIEQDFPGSVQILLGFDTPNAARLDLDKIVGPLPPNRSVIAFYPGYSTSRRHGGLHPAFDAGALRIVLCYLANARYLAFLDDDNWWSREHLRSLRDAIEGVQWSFGTRWFVDPRNDAVICVDDWESVGPGRGVWQAKFGGFVDPNCLMIDKLACDPVLRWWGIPLPNDPGAMSCDRHVFQELRNNYAWRSVAQPSVFYRINLEDPVHEDRANVMRLRGVVLSP